MFRIYWFFASVCYFQLLVQPLPIHLFEVSVYCVNALWRVIEFVFRIRIEIIEGVYSLLNLTKNMENLRIINLNKYDAMKYDFREH